MKIFKGMLRGAMGIGTETNQVLACFLKKLMWKGEKRNLM